MTLTTPPRTLHRRGTDRSGAETFAAAAPINLADPNHGRYLQNVFGKSKWRAMKPWDWYAKIGEVHYALSRAGRIAGYARLHAETLTSTGWERLDDGSPADDIVQQIYSPFGGLRGLLATYFVLMKVTGDSLLVRVRDEEGEDGYHFIAPDAIDTNSLERLATSDPARMDVLKWVTSPFGANDNNTMVREVARNDVLGRVWVPGIRFVDLPDSAIAALDTECEVLWATTQNMKAKLVSRFAAAGILFVPDTMMNIQVQGKDTMKMGVNGLQYLVEAMTENMDNWTDAEALFPILMSGPADVGEKIRHIILDREVFATDIEIRRELIDRIYAGLDIQSQATKGVGQATHWSAWAVSDEELRLVAKPDLENCCWAMTRLILQDSLMRPESQGGHGMAAAEAALYRIGFDMDDAASKTNMQEDGRQLNDRGYLKGDRLLEVSGFSSTDRMEEEELVRHAGRVSHNPVLMLHKGKIADVDWDLAREFGGRRGPAGAVGTDPQSGPGVGDPGSPNPSDQERD